MLTHTVMLCVNPLQPVFRVITIFYTYNFWNGKLTSRKTCINVMEWLRATYETRMLCNFNDSIMSIFSEPDIIALGCVPSYLWFIWIVRSVQASFLRSSSFFMFGGKTYHQIIRNFSHWRFVSSKLDCFTHKKSNLFWACLFGWFKSFSFEPTYLLQGFASCYSWLLPLRKTFSWQLGQQNQVDV